MRRVDQLFRLDGRVAIVTGGTGHLGAAIGAALSEQGAAVVVVDRLEAACEARAAELAAAAATDCTGYAADLGRPESAKAIIDHVLDRYGRLDVLVNNAAFTGDSGLAGWAVAFDDQLLESWDAALRVNLTATFLLAQAAHAALARSRAGSIVNIGSIYAVGGPDLRLYEGTAMGSPAAYAASKGGLVQLTRYLATVLAPGVRVNAISPGGIERDQPAAFQQRYAERVPLRRMGREEDVKGAVAYLASDASAYVTGQNLLVDGGWTAW